VLGAQTTKICVLELFIGNCWKRTQDAVLLHVDVRDLFIIIMDVASGHLCVHVKSCVFVGPIKNISDFLF
jgi:hypothetical protein